MPNIDGSTSSAQYTTYIQEQDVGGAAKIHQAARQQAQMILQPVLGDDYAARHAECLPPPSPNSDPKDLPADADFKDSFNTYSMFLGIVELMMESQKELKRVENEAELDAAKNQFKMQKESIKENRHGIGFRVAMKCAGAAVSLAANYKGMRTATGRSATATAPAIEGNQTAGQSWNQAGGSLDGVSGAIVDANKQEHDANAAEDQNFAERFKKLNDAMHDGGQSAHQMMKEIIEAVKKESDQHDRTVTRPMNSV